jgi:hypothetical protein
MSKVVFKTYISSGGSVSNSRFVKTLEVFVLSSKFTKTRVIPSGGNLASIFSISDLSLSKHMSLLGELASERLSLADIVLDEEDVVPVRVSTFHV